METTSFLNLIQKVGDEAMRRTVADFKKTKKPAAKTKLPDQPFGLTRPKLPGDVWV